MNEIEKQKQQNQLQNKQRKNVANVSKVESWMPFTSMWDTTRYFGSSHKLGPKNVLLVEWC